jgi:hypothetical protein
VIFFEPVGFFLPAFSLPSALASDQCVNPLFESSCRISAPILQIPGAIPEDIAKLNSHPEKMKLHAAASSDHLNGLNGAGTMRSTSPPSRFFVLFEPNFWAKKDKKTNSISI